MRSILMPLALVALSVLAAGAEPDAKSLPGPFHPYNVTGKFAGKFHCLVCENGLQPGVLVFVRGSALPEVKELVQGLDDLVDKDPRAGIALAVVFLSPDLPDVVTDDDARESLARTLSTEAKEAGLKHAVLALESPAKVKDYVPDDQAAVTVLIYKKLEILDRQTLSKQAAKEKKAVVLDAVRMKLGTPKK